MDDLNAPLTAEELLGVLLGITIGVASALDVRQRAALEAFLRAQGTPGKAPKRTAALLNTLADEVAKGFRRIG